MSEWTFSPTFAWVCGILIALLEIITVILGKWHKIWNTKDKNSEIWKKKNLFIAEIYNNYISHSIEKILIEYFVYYSQNKFRFTPFYDFIKSISKSVNKINNLDPNSEEKEDMKKDLKKKIKEYPFEIGIGELELGKKELIKLKIGSTQIFYPEKGLNHLKFLYILCQFFTIILFISSILISRFTNPDNVIDSFLWLFFSFTVILFINLIAMFLKYYIPYKKIVKKYKTRIKISGID